MKRLYSYSGLVSVILFAIWVTLPFFGPNFIPTHDGEFHIIRFFEFFTMLSEGHLIPRWAPGLNSGYGLPLFIFHYPFPNYVGSLFHLGGLSFIDSFKSALAFGYITALVGMFFFFRSKHTARTSLGLTIIIGLIPYWFVDLNIRGSIGELWALAWLSICLAALAWKKMTIFVASIFLLCISHNILAMLFIMFLLVYLLFFHKRGIPYLITGSLMAAYFWLPALMEKQYMIGLNTATYSDHFVQFFQLIIPSWGSGFSAPGIPQGEMSQQLGIVSIAIVVIGILMYKKIKDYQEKRLLFFGIACAFISALMMLEVSRLIWQLIPFIQFVQYPWRFLSVYMVGIMLISMVVIPKLPRFIVAGIIFAALISSWSYMRPVLYEPRTDEFYLTNKNFTDGTSSMGNSFSTIWTPWKSERSSSRVTIIDGDSTIELIESTSITDTVLITARTVSTINIHRLYFPGWTVSVDGANIPIDFTTDGTLRFVVSPGTHKLKATFNDTPIRWLGNTISVVSLGVLVLLKRKKYANSV